MAARTIVMAYELDFYHQEKIRAEGSIGQVYQIYFPSRLIRCNTRILFGFLTSLRSWSNSSALQFSSILLEKIDKVQSYDSLYGRWHSLFDSVS